MSSHHPDARDAGGAHTQTVLGVVLLALAIATAGAYLTGGIPGVPDTDSTTQTTSGPSASGDTASAETTSTAAAPASAPAWAYWDSVCEKDRMDAKNWRRPRCHYVDTRTGEKVLQTSFEAVTEFVGGYAYGRSIDDDLWRRIDTSATVVSDTLFRSPPFFDTDRRPHPPPAPAVLADGSHALLSASGTFLLPPRYTEISDFDHGFATVRDSSGTGLVDTTGTFVLPTRYVEISDFYAGHAVVRDSSGAGIVDSTGSIVLPVGTYGDILPTDQRRDRYPELPRATPWRYFVVADRPVPRSTRRSRAGPNDRPRRAQLGLATFDRLLIEPQYRRAERITPRYALFSDTLANVPPDSVHLYRLPDADLLVDGSLRWVEPFRDGHTVAWRDSLWGIVDTTGAVLVDPAYREISYFDDGLAVGYRNRTYHVVDTTGTVTSTYSFAALRNRPPLSDRRTDSLRSACAPEVRDTSLPTCLATHLYGPERIDRELLDQIPETGEQWHRIRFIAYGNQGFARIETYYEDVLSSLYLPRGSYPLVRDLIRETFKHQHDRTATGWPDRMLHSTDSTYTLSCPGAVSPTLVSVRLLPSGLAEVRH